MLEEHLPLIVTGLLAFAVGAGILIVSAFIGPRRRTAIKGAAFECGNPPSGDARQRFHVRFFTVAILFLVFDIEAVFIYPWAIVFHDSITNNKPAVAPLLAMLEVAVFVGVVVIGLIYVWRKGALEWGPTARTGLEDEPQTDH